MIDNSELIKLFLTYKCKITEFCDYLRELEIVESPLYLISMDDASTETNGNGPESISTIPVTRLDDADDVISLLNNHLEPAYRNNSTKVATRLIGHIQFDGSLQNLETALQLAEGINSAKKAWGEKLKEIFPAMHNRSRYLANTSEFKGLITRSIHRQIPLDTHGIYASKFSWSKKGIKSRVIQFKDIKSILKGSQCELDNESILEKIRIAERRFSSSDYFCLIHRYPVPVHPIQTLYYKIDGVRQTPKHIKAALPLLVFGPRKITTNELRDFNSEVELRKGQSTRYDYHPILPEFGVYQRRKTNN